MCAMVLTEKSSMNLESLKRDYSTREHLGVQSVHLFGLSLRFHGNKQDAPEVKRTVAIGTD